MRITFLACVAVVAGGIVAASAQNPESTSFSGKVVETTNAASYTYVLIDTGEKKVWAAAPRFEVKAGDKVAVASAMAMPNYESRTLKKTFDVVYFTGSVVVNDKKTGGSMPVAPTTGGQALPDGHPKIDGKGKPANPPSVDLSNVKKAQGGKTVSEIVTDAKKLKGKDVTVRGKVVKYNEGVMGKNWLHIRDGSGTPANNDLTVTTQTPTKVGDTVLVKGKVSTDRNFGGGYLYAVIVEDAKVTVE